MDDGTVRIIGLIVIFSMIAALFIAGWLVSRTGDLDKTAKILELQMEGRCIYCMDIAIAIYPPTKIYSCTKHYERFMSAVQEPDKVEWWAPCDHYSQETIKEFYELEKESLRENIL